MTSITYSSYMNQEFADCDHIYPASYPNYITNIYGSDWKQEYYKEYHKKHQEYFNANYWNGFKNIICSVSTLALSIFATFMAVTAESRTSPMTMCYAITAITSFTAFLCIRHHYAHLTKENDRVLDGFKDAFAQNFEFYFHKKDQLDTQLLDEE